MKRGGWKPCEPLWGTDAEVAEGMESLQWKELGQTE